MGHDRHEARRARLILAVRHEVPVDRRRYPLAGLGQQRISRIPEAAAHPAGARASRDPGCHARRAGENPQRAVAREGADMLAAIGRNDYVVALEIAGKPMSTEQLERLAGRALARCAAAGAADRRPRRARAGMPGSGRPKLVAVAPDAAACPGAGGGRRTALSRDEPAGRPSVSPRLKRASTRVSSTHVRDFVYLASGSPRRRELLQQIGVPYPGTQCADVDESRRGARGPCAYVVEAGRGQGRAGRRQRQARARGGARCSRPIPRWCIDGENSGQAGGDRGMPMRMLLRLVGAHP